MSVFVIDASIVLKWFLPEADSPAARRLMDSGHQFMAPDLLFSEVGNAVWKRVRRRELSADDGQRLIGDIGDIAVETVATRELMSDACAIAMASGQTVYDCMYLALAVRLDTQLVTADRRFRDGVAANPILAKRIRMTDEFPA